MAFTDINSEDRLVQKTLGPNAALLIIDPVPIPMDDVCAPDAEHPVLAIRETKTGKQRAITLDRGALRRRPAAA